MYICAKYTGTQAEFIKNAVGAGLYATPSDVIRKALRLLIDPTMSVPRAAKPLTNGGTSKPVASNVSLPAALESAVRAAITTEGYKTSAEVARDCLNMLIFKTQGHLHPNKTVPTGIKTNMSAEERARLILKIQERQKATAGVV